MTPLVLERRFAVPIDLVFDYVSKSEFLLQWWGPEGLTCTGDLDLSRPGQWDSTMSSPNGSFRVSGQVTKVARPNLVAFTWGWHDETGKRGHESHVMIELEAEGDGATKFTLTHRDLADEESKANHNDGWTSSLRKLEAVL